MSQGCGADCGCMPQILKSLPSSASMQPCHWERPHHSLPQASVAPSVFQVLCGENSCSVLYFVLKKEKKKIRVDLEAGGQGCGTEAVYCRPVLGSDFLGDREQTQRKASGRFRVYRKIQGQVSCELHSR